MSIVVFIALSRLSGSRLCEKAVSLRAVFVAPCGRQHGANVAKLIRFCPSSESESDCRLHHAHAVFNGAIECDGNQGGVGL
jgi:hypothetical protein